MHGVLVVDKPAGLTSAAVVAEVKRRLGADRVGHTGTLDPMATGVLPIAVGEGTKLAPFLLAEDKSYEGELELGISTDTLDAEGTVTGRADPSGVTEAALLAALAEWVGVRTQIPPMFSALKHEGRRLHELARAGLEVERAPRAIRIDRLALMGFAPPRARFTVDCSKGTYVRSLVRDIGAALGCGAVLTALRRTKAGRFTLAGALPLAEVRPGAQLCDPAAALEHLATIRLDPGEVTRVRQGKPLAAAPGLRADRPIRLLNPDGTLLAVAEVRGDELRSLRVFNYGLTPENH